MNQATTRREWLQGTAAVMAGAAVGRGAAPAMAATTASAPQYAFSYCLNTATIQGQALSLREQVEVAIAAGYQALEPWVRDVKAYADGGGSLEDIAKLAADGGLQIVSGIGFPQWINDDADVRAEALQQVRGEMQLLHRIGSRHIAAPPVGATNGRLLELDAVAERYHALLKVGREMGVVPQVEVWGFSKNLRRLSEAIYVAAEAGHADACVLADAYHLYKGGSAFEGVRQLSRQATHCFHINDYPDTPPAEIGDADRIFPGDGVGPVADMVRALAQNGCRCHLSLELFNRTYWAQDALKVAKAGLAKTRQVVEQALQDLPASEA
ncbi:MAG: sugar phosphate isomerase/epimerase family protein [Phycisphaeraceae bacterium]